MNLPSTFTLDDLERDALAELVNIGVGRAAASLRTMVGDPVMPSVPSVAIVTRERAAAIIGEREAGRLVAVHQLFEGDISGRALLIFPEAKSLELVAAITGGDLSHQDMVELEQEVLAETGNIILNGCLATIANMLQRSLKMSIPEIAHGSSADLFNLSGTSASNDAVLFLYINFSIHQREIHGYIAVLMDLPALVALKVLLGEMIDRAREPLRETDVAS